ncbi:MAG: beta-lactamase family protein [Bdellovibrionales bacterium]|nr:beta-lactamase family protein [Bdellovibrionales bacterium]
MFKHLAIFALLTLVLSSCSSTSSVYSTKRSAQMLAENTDIKDIVDNIAMAEINSKHCAGVVVGIVTPEGEQYYSYGLKDVEKNEPMPTDALFQIGSITKIFTSSLLLKLDQEKIISINDPISKLFPPDFHPVTKGLGDLTFARLSSHSSALPAEHQSIVMIKNAVGFLWTGHNIWDTFNEQMMWDFFGQWEFGNLESTKYKYSNTAYIFLGNLLGQAIPGKDYETLLFDKILTPMKITDLGFDLTAEQRAKVATGYSGDAPIFMRAHQYMEPWEIQKGLRSAGSLYAGARGLAKFLKVNMQIDKDTTGFDFTEAHKRRVKSIYNGHVGLGWFIETLPVSRREFIYANGIISGYTSFIGFDDNAKVGVVVLQNAMNMKNEVGRHLLDRLVYNFNKGLGFHIPGIKSVRE